MVVKLVPRLEPAFWWAELGQGLKLMTFPKCSRLDLEDSLAGDPCGSVSRVYWYVELDEVGPLVDKVMSNSGCGLRVS